MPLSREPKASAPGEERAQCEGMKIVKSEKSAKGRKSLRALSCLFLAVVSLCSLPTHAGASGDALAGALADRLVRETGRTKGVCLVLGPRDGQLALAITRRSEFMVHVLTADQAALTAVRRTLDVDDLYGPRVSAEEGDLRRLPHPDYLANLVVCELPTDAKQDAAVCAEAMRVLQPGGLVAFGRPERATPDRDLSAADRKRGSAPLMSFRWGLPPFLGPQPSAWLAGGEPHDGAEVARDSGADALRRRLAAAGLMLDQVIELNGAWALLRRSRPKEMGEWTHERCGPHNNLCVEDTLVKVPFQTLWINAPRDFTKFGIVLAASGRYILRHGGITHTGLWQPSETPDLVQVFDGFNGTRLWEKPLRRPGGSGLVAVGDALYAEAGGTLYALSAVDGRPLWSHAAPNAADTMIEWIAYAMSNDTLVAALSNAPRKMNAVPPAQVLVGLAPPDGAVRWRVNEPAGIASIAAGDGLVFAAIAGRQVAAFDLATGRERWRTEHPARGALRLHRGRLYLDSGVLAAADGALVSRQAPRGILIGNQVVSGGLGPIGGDGAITAADLESAARTHLIAVPRDPFSPKTGIPDGGIYGRCIQHTASTYCYFFHQGGTVIGDLLGRRLFPVEAFRSNCRTGVIAGNGLVYNSASGCGCTLAVRGSVALVPVSEGLHSAKPEAEAPQLEKGPAFDQPIAVDDTADSWPCFRGRATRDCRAPTAPPGALSETWRVRLPGRLTPPASATGLVFVGTDRHAVYALDAATGAIRWRYVTGGAIDVTPACWRGRVYAGSQDGHVYGLRADTGALIWRFRGAPLTRKALVFGRLESLWPIGGGVIVEDRDKSAAGVAYFYAGRCSYDRVFVYALDAATGAVLWMNDKAGQAVEVTGSAGGISPHGVSPSGVLAASNDLLYVPHGPTFPAGIRKSDGRLLFWNRRGDSRERSNINIQALGGWRLSLGGGFLFAGGHNPFTDHRQHYIALDARSGRIWGQDDPRFFPQVLRDATGKTLMPQNYKWGMAAVNFGGGIAPVVANGGIFTFDDRQTTYSDLAQSLARQFGAVPNAALVRWTRAGATDALIVADRVVLAAGGKTVQALSLADGRPLWSATLSTAGPVLPDGLALAAGRLFAVTASGELAALAPRSNAALVEKPN
jgi:outer membrane protein assembly factor BamB